MCAADPREPAPPGGDQGSLFGGTASSSSSSSGAGAARGPASSATLDGVLERITFQSPETGWTVARIAVNGGGAATAVGELIGVREGMALRLHGAWVDDRKFGRQFRANDYEEDTPKTLDGVTRFLAGDVAGIGPELARRMVAKFGMDTLAVAEHEPARLTEVAGIGDKRANEIARAIAAQGRWKRLRLFLRTHGLSASFARSIDAALGPDAVGLIRENPYRLIREIRGIGFRIADALAISLGLARDAPARLTAGLEHALRELVGDGHTYAPEAVALDRAAQLLAVDRTALGAPLERLEREHRIVREVLGDQGRCVSLAAVATLEKEAGGAIAELIRTPNRTSTLDVERTISEFELASGLALAPQQRRAVIAAATEKCVVITGGPGVGKTTIVRAVVDLARRMRRDFVLGAPTGRAAKRLAEATGADARTLHRVLEYQPQTDSFGRDALRPLDADFVIVDETSMVDLELFHALVTAIKPRAQLVLVGDVDQLPSVGAGAVLGDVIASGAATVVRLTEIFRQAAQSRIVTSAHRINHGELPDVEAPGASGAASDFYFIARDEPVAARNTIIELVAERIPARFGFDRTRDVQVLVPVHRGDLGTIALNSELQARLNPTREGAAELTRGERVFRAGDKVMQIENDYERQVVPGPDGVFNGDIGIIEAVDADQGVMRVALADGRVTSYERADLDQLVHAYAVTIHKSQGSEYAAVIIALANQHFVMLGRSLLYTAVTRGKKLVVIVGSRRALAMAVRNATARARWTWLAERIRAAAEGDAGAGDGGAFEADADA
jgi:exodeoxyribonuclease V alpha subunit